MSKLCTDGASAHMRRMLEELLTRRLKLKLGVRDGTTTVSRVKPMGMYLAGLPGMKSVDRDPNGSKETVPSGHISMS